MTVHNTTANAIWQSCAGDCDPFFTLVHQNISARYTIPLNATDAAALFFSKFVNNSLFNAVAHIPVAVTLSTTAALAFSTHTPNTFDVCPQPASVTTTAAAAVSSTSTTGKLTTGGMCRIGFFELLLII